MELLLEEKQSEVVKKPIRKKNRYHILCKVNTAFYPKKQAEDNSNKLDEFLNSKLREQLEDIKIDQESYQNITVHIYEHTIRQMGKEMHKITTQGNKVNNNTLKKAGGMFMAFIPLEAKKVLSATNNEVTNNFVGNLKALTIFSAIGTALASVFNWSMLAIVVLMILLFLADWIIGAFPKPQEMKDKLEETEYNTFGERIHIFGYMLLIFIGFSAVQVVVIGIINFFDDGSLQALAESYPFIETYILKGPLGLQTFGALYVVGYYVSRLKKHLLPVFSMKLK